jgi:hypothetical protein
VNSNAGGIPCTIYTFRLVVGYIEKIIISVDEQIYLKVLLPRKCKEVLFDDSE